MFEQEPLKYEYDALEPYIDKETMELHYSKHHKGYVDKLNKAVEGTEFAEMNLFELIENLDRVPEEIRTAVANNGGQHLNHTLFWKNLSPNGGDEPTGELLSTIESTFGSFKDFKEKFAESASTLFGSGWTFLALNSEGGLEIIKKSNQGNPIEDGKRPILALDVWEHAYYLKYKNKRPDYIEAFWNVVDWEEVQERFDEEI